MFRSRRSSNARYLMTGFYDQVSMNLLDLFPTLFNETNMVLFHSNRFISCIPPCINAFHTCPLAGSSVPMSFQRLPATSRYRALPKGCISQKSRHLTSQMKAVRRSFITGTILYSSPCNEERIHQRSLLCSRHRRLCSIRSHLRVPYRLWVIESLNLPNALPTYSPYCLTGLQQRGIGQFN